MRASTQQHPSIDHRPSTIDTAHASRAFFRLSTFDFRLIGLALLALGYRLILLSTTMAPVDSDQAVSGIMSRHILQGDRPIFFYGQSYNGAIEAYLTAVVFRLWGSSDLTLRLVPALLSVLLVVQLYDLARRLYHPFVALATGLWLALPPAVLAFWSMAAGAGYIEATVLGTGLCMIAVRRWGLRRPRRYDLPVLGLLAGLGVWAQPMIADYLVALALAGLPLAWRARARLGRIVMRQAPLAGLLFVLGAAPWLAYALRHGGASVAVLTDRAQPWSLPDVLRRLVTETAPVLLGGAIPSGYASQFAQYIVAHPLPYILTLCAGAYLIVRLVAAPGGLIAQARALLSAEPLADAPLAMLVISVFALYMASRFKTLSWTTSNPRYLLPLYTATPYLLACLAGSRKSKVESRKWAAVRKAEGESKSMVDGRWPMVRHGRLFAALSFSQRPGLSAPMPHTSRSLFRLSTFDFRLIGLALALAINVYGGAHYADLPSNTMPSVAPLVSKLLARGDQAVYADYWIAWRLAFASDERLIPVVTLGEHVDHNPRGARYPPYLARAAHVERWAYIVPDRYLPALEARLRREHISYVRWRWGTSALFFNHWDWGTPNIVESQATQPPRT